MGDEGEVYKSEPHAHLPIGLLVIGYRDWVIGLSSGYRAIELSMIGPLGY
jgi:hypothetical protein